MRSNADSEATIARADASSSSNWPTVALETLVDPARPITYGIVLPGPDIPNGVPYVRVVDIKNGAVLAHQLRRTSAKIAYSYRRSALNEGDLVVSIRGHVGRTAFVPAAAHGANLTQDTARVAILPTAERRYVRWFIESPLARHWMAQHTKGVAVTGINLGDLRKLPLPLPPLPEQRRIADILDKADAIRRKRKQAIALTEDLLRSAFLDMFGDPVMNPKGWPIKRLGDAIDRLDAGWSANGENRSRTNDEFGVLKISAVTSGVFRAEEHKAVSATEIDRELVTPRAGDLLFSRANTRELVAATCLVERDEPRLFLPDKIWRVVPRSGVVTAPYLRFLLAHDRFRGELTKTATGTSGSMLNVSMDKLRTLRGPIPPLATQERFAQFVWKTLRSKGEYEAAEVCATDLFSSLMNRAFSRRLSNHGAEGHLRSRSSGATTAHTAT